MILEGIVTLAAATGITGLLKAGQVSQKVADQDEDIKYIRTRLDSLYDKFIEVSRTPPKSNR